MTGDISTQKLFCGDFCILKYLQLWQENTAWKLNRNEEILTFHDELREKAKMKRYILIKNVTGFFLSLMYICTLSFL